MSRMHNEHKEYQKKFDRYKTSQEKPAPRRKILPRIKGNPKPAPDEKDSTGKDNIIMRKKISILLNEIKEIRELQKRFVEENKENKVQLDDTKKLIEEYNPIELELNDGQVFRLTNRKLDEIFAEIWKNNTKRLTGSEKHG